MQPAVDQVAHAAILGGDPPAYIGVGVSEVLYERVRRDADISLDMSQTGSE